MQSFKVLDHTADLKMEFSGENMEELLNASVEGLSIYLFEKTGEKIERTYKRKFDKKNEIDFFIGFLNEILYLMQSKKILPKLVLIKDDNVIIKGEKTEKKPLVEIKAATFHNAKIEREGNILKAVITFDL